MDDELKLGSKAGKSSDNYNGNTTSTYSWSQTIRDLDVKIPVPKEIRKGKDVQVNIKTDSLEVGLSGQRIPIVSGSFTFPVDKEESYWNLIPGESVSIFIQKSKERWWTALLNDEEPIDPSSIQAFIAMEDMGQEEQMKVQEMIWKEEQKMQGRPTNDQNVEAILKKAWDAEGSPFKGRAYDPSTVNFGSDNLPPEIMEALRNSES